MLNHRITKMWSLSNAALTSSKVSCLGGNLLATGKLCVAISSWTSFDGVTNDTNMFSEQNNPEILRGGYSCLSFCIWAIEGDGSISEEIRGLHSLPGSQRAEVGNSVEKKKKLVPFYLMELCLWVTNLSCMHRSHRMKQAPSNMGL